MAYEERKPPLKKFKLFKRVAILDEHALPATETEPAVSVGPQQLERIAANGNARVERTNDWTPLVVGHTRKGGPELPVKGYAGNFVVDDFVNDEGRTVKAVYCDQFLDDEDGEADRIAREFPRRSVELWTGRMQVDPICMLGGTSPERDLGVLVRYARDPETNEVDAIRICPAPRQGVRREERAVSDATTDVKGQNKGSESRREEGEPRRSDKDPKAERPPERNDGGDGIADTNKKVGDLTVGELFALWSETAPMKFLQELMQQADGMQGGMGDEFGPPGGGPGGPPDPEGRLFHEPGPVHYDAAGGPGPMGSPGLGYDPESFRGYSRDPYDPLDDYGGRRLPPHRANPETPVAPSTPRADDQVVKLSRELAELRKAQEERDAEQAKRIAALEAENEAIRRLNRANSVQDRLRQFCRDEQLAVDEEVFAEDFEKLRVAELDDAGVEKHKDWMKRRYGRRLPNNGQRVDYAREAPRNGAQAGQMGADEAAKIQQFAVRNRIRDWDKAVAEYRKSQQG